MVSGAKEASLKLWRKRKGKEEEEQRMLFWFIDGCKRRTIFRGQQETASYFLSYYVVHHDELLWRMDCRRLSVSPLGVLLHSPSSLFFLYYTPPPVFFNGYVKALRALREYFLSLFIILNGDLTCIPMKLMVSQNPYVFFLIK